jgi:hypothetical protein
LLGTALALIGFTGTIGAGISYFYLLDRSNAALVMHEWGHAWGLEHCDAFGCLMNRKRDIAHLLAVVQNLSFCDEHDRQLREAIENYLQTTGKKSLGKGLVFGFRYSGNIEAVAKTVSERLQMYKVDVIEYLQIEDGVPEDCVDPEEGWLRPNCAFEILRELGIDIEEYSTSRLLAEVNDKPTFSFEILGRSTFYHGIYYQVCFSPLNHTKWGLLSSVLIPVGVYLLTREG